MVTGFLVAAFGDGGCGCGCSESCGTSRNEAEDTLVLLFRGLPFFAELLGVFGGRAVDGLRVDLRFCFFPGATSSARVAITCGVDTYFIRRGRMT